MLARGPNININSINRLKGWGANRNLLRIYCVYSTAVVTTVTQKKVSTERVKFILKHTNATSPK